MFSRIAFLLAATLAVFTSASTSALSEDLQITDLSITKVLGGNVTLHFTVHDPDPLTNATRSCGGTWTTGSKGYPTGAYAICGHSNFGWNMGAFTSIKNFRLELTHSYIDPAVGQAPYDVITTFSHANITEKNHPCRSKNGQTVCAQKAGTKILANIWGYA